MIGHKLQFMLLSIISKHKIYFKAAYSKKIYNMRKCGYAAGTVLHKINKCVGIISHRFS
ncbi:hypothetical protein LY28_02695 [Ruminiclostridium sufflavum DSM 19573]|uniref:Uncharacterized protein n=1 Tax=Ruminiclostridium sufflavum DSM 19573 TaxID=1121337 RepID=A0A318XLM4_9FIRM|nr:hypothetical protein LY28_02695 [Ruminiclostridium sufflavum DSM 19573]